MKKKTQRSIWRFSILYAFLLIAIFSATTAILLRALRNSNTDSAPVTKIEEIYVYLPQEESKIENEISTDTEPRGYLVQEYHGQIGIFSSDGTLLEILDTYVKTLPEADRALLGEGIWIETREALNALIEDYSH